MGYAIGSSEVIAALLLVKAVIAVLAVMLFVYYKVNWDRAKRHLPVHYFFAKWRSAKHAVYLGFAAMGFAIGFCIELIGVQYGLSANLARFLSSVFEVFALFYMLYVFFTLAMEDVPSFQHISEGTRHRLNAPLAPAKAAPAASAQGAAKKAASAKKKGRRRGKRGKR